MKKGPNWVVGLTFVLVGSAWAVSNVFGLQVDFRVLWPLFLIVPGLMLWMAYLTGNKQANVGVLIPANILLFLGLTFMFNSVVESVLGFKEVWVLTTAMYSTGPIAIAFWVTWLASRQNLYMVPAIILTIVTACIASFTVPMALIGQPFFAQFGNVIWPFALICVGGFIIMSPFWTVFSGKSEQDWEKWGEEIGRGMEEWGKQFEQNVEEWGKKVEEGFDGKRDAEVVEGEVGEKQKENGGE